MFNTAAVFPDVYMRQDRKRGICVLLELNGFPEKRLNNKLSVVKDIVHSPPFTI